MTKTQLLDVHGREVHAPRLPDGQDFHLFLSHVWSTGQDQMRVIKQLLVERIPDLSVFLDVDDLKEGRGAEYVMTSDCVLGASHLLPNRSALAAWRSHGHVRSLRLEQYSCPLATSNRSTACASCSQR